MARGRPRKWIAEKASAEDVQFATTLCPLSTTAREWYAFCELNAETTSNKGVMTKLYVAQQLRQGLDASSVLTHVNIISNLGMSETTHGGDARSLKSTLLRMKARSGGPQIKPLIEMGLLELPLRPAAVTERDLQYQACWWLLVMTGARPANLRNAIPSLVPGGVSVMYRGRKVESNASHRPIIYRDEEWSVPCYLRHHIKPVGIGTEKNIAACVNSWVARWMRKHHAEVTTHITSTQPRVYRDHKLRVLHEKGQLSEKDYRLMMDHSLEVSDKHYFTLPLAAI